MDSFVKATGKIRTYYLTATGDRREEWSSEVLNVCRGMAPQEILPLAAAAAI